MTQYGVFLFTTTWAALRAEKALLKVGLMAKLVPTPRQFSSECGLALRFEWSEVERARSLLSEAHLEYASVYPL